MRFSWQVYWGNFPFPPPVDHILSELSTMTCPYWVAIYGIAHSFIELLFHNKAVRGTWKCIHAFFFFICPASLCLCVGEFIPFIFKVIIDMYDPITIFLVVWGLFSVGIFSLLYFLPRESPLVFIVNLNSLNFCLSGKLLIYPSNLN